MAEFPAPREEFALTHFIVTSDIPSTSGLKREQCGVPGRRA